MPGSVSTMVNMTEAGNSIPIGGGAPIYVDNGDKASVISELARLYVERQNLAKELARLEEEDPT